MRKFIWIGGISLIFLLSIACAIIIPILLNNFIWTPLIIVLSIWLVIAIILVIVLLIVKLSKKPQIPEEINSKDAEKKAREESLIDEDDPDNFIILNKLTYKIGEKGIAEKTPILILKGWGSETNKPRTALVNLKIPDKEISWIKAEKANDDEYIKTWAIRMAETQPDEIKDTITEGRDKFGLPIITRETVRQSSPSEIKEQKEKEDAESRNML